MLICLKVKILETARKVTCYVHHAFCEYEVNDKVNNKPKNKNKNINV